MTSCWRKMSEITNTRFQTAEMRAARQFHRELQADTRRYHAQQERAKRKRIEDELRRNVTVRSKRRSTSSPKERQTIDKPSSVARQTRATGGGLSQNDDESEDTLCGICFEGYKNPQALRCGHTFCVKCILTWATGRMANRRRCPTCRQSMTETND